MRSGDQHLRAWHGLMTACAGLILLALANAAHAIEPYSCRNGLFPQSAGQVRQARAGGDQKTKVYFRDDAEGCPQKDSCIGKVYVVGGDELLVSKQDSGWSCVWYFGKKREFVGWMPGEALTVAPKAVVRSSDWIGTWVPIGGDDRIEIHEDKEVRGALTVTGEASWHGGSDGAGEEVVHEGSFDGSASPSGDLLTVGDGKDQYDCMVKMQLVSGNLVVSDNSYCGGANVRFDDVYRKRP